jgi:hypothetical protein
MTENRQANVNLRVGCIDESPLDLYFRAWQFAPESLRFVKSRVCCAREIAPDSLTGKLQQVNKK